MKVTYPIPDKLVSDYVQSILVIENYDVKVPFCLPLFANGTPTLLFQTSKGQIKDNSYHLTLFGQTILPDKLWINENFTLIAYFLKPYSIKSLFGIAAHELTNNPIDFNLLTKDNLEEQLLNAETTDEMIVLLDSYLFSLASKSKATEPRVKYATEKIFSNPNKIILTKIQKEIFTTERTFQRMFETNIGVSPNQFRKIIQFSKAFLQINKKQFHTLSEVAFKHDYADQSHYIRTFKEFTNLTPKEYLALRMIS